jgi:hypothetical protein
MNVLPSAHPNVVASGPGGVAPLRWTLLSVACELCDPKSADFLLRTALGRSPGSTPADRDAQPADDFSIRVLAVDALRAIAWRYPEVRGHLIRLIRSCSEPAILYEAVRAAEDLGLHGEAQNALPRLRGLEAKAARPVRETVLERTA